MKVLCIYDGFEGNGGKPPRYGDVCTVCDIWLDSLRPDGVQAYRFEEFPQKEPFRFGAWRLRCAGSREIVPNFIEIEETQNEETESIAEQIELLY